MAKYFEVDFRKGSFNDSLSRAVSLTGSPSLNKKEKGFSFYGNDSNYLTYSSQVVPDNAFTIVIYYKLNKISSLNRYNSLILNVAETRGLYASYSTGNILLLLGATNYAYFNNTPDYKWHCLIVTIPGNAQTDISNCKAYLDAVQLTAGTTISTVPQDSRTTFTRIKGSISNSATDILYVATYDHVFTEQERAAAYKDFLNSYPIQKEKYPNVVNKPLDLSREKENTVGISILNGWNFNDGNWTTSNATIVDQNTFTTSGSNGYIRTTSHTLVQGTKYNLRLKLTVSNGIVFRIYDYNATSIQYTTTGTGSSVEINTTFTATAVSGTGIRLLLATSGQCDIDYMFIEPITGLVAAYNLIPQGNTLVDISGNGANLTLNGKYPFTTKDSIDFKGLSTYTASSSTYADMSTNNFSISCRFKTPKVFPASIKCLLAKGSGGGNGYSIRINNSDLQVRIQATGGTNQTSNIISSLLVNTYYNLTVNFDRSLANGILCYINGVYIGAIAYSAGNQTGSLTGGSSLNIGAFDSSRTWPFVGEIVDVRIHNRLLSLTEIKAYHNQFVAPSLSIDFSDEGADGVAKVPSGWVKQSGSFKVQEWQNIRSTLYTSDFSSGVDGWPNSGNVTLTGNIDNISDGSTSYNDCLRIVDNNVNGDHYTKKTVSTSVIAGKRYKVKFKYYIPNSNINLLYLYCQYGASSDNVLLPINSIRGSWTNFSEEVSKTQTDIGLTFLPSKTSTYAAYVGSGESVYIKDITVEEIPPLPTFKPGTKYLECVTAGSIAIPSKQAYGTWEFDWYKGGGSNTLAVFFSSSKPNNNIDTPFYPGYGFYFNNGEQFILGKFNTGSSFNVLLATGNSYGIDNTWYRIRVIRSLAGSFTCLAKGGSLVPTTGYDGWTLLTLSGTGSTGTNPVTDNTYTTSEYAILDIDAGDRIANIQLMDGIKQY